MALPRASTAPAALGRTVFRRAATQNRNQAWRQITRRHYASEHGGQKSSELPWIIGSVGFTVPAAVWLFNQGSSGVHHPEAANEHQKGGVEEEEEEEEDKPDESPQEKADDSGEESDRASKDEEGHDGEAAQEDNPDATPQEKADDSGEESKKASKDEEGHDDEAAQEDKDDSKDESKDDSKDDSKDESKDESKDDSDSKGANYTKEGRKLSDDGYELPGPNAPGQINKPSGGKGPGEGGKGSRARTETKSEKDSASDHSGAQNPYLDDDEKSKKGEGVKDTAKIHGTVNSRRDARGDGKPNE